MDDARSHATDALQATTDEHFCEPDDTPPSSRVDETRQLPELSAGDCDGSYTVTRTFTATTGNSSSECSDDVALLDDDAHDCFRQLHEVTIEVSSD